MHSKLYKQLEEGAMALSTLVPAAGTIPVPQLLFDVLLVATFALHIILMNIVVGGVFIALARAARGTFDLPGGYTGKLPTLMALTINLGVAPLLFVQVVYGAFGYTSSVLMGSFWLAVVGVLIIGYYGLYVYDLKGSGFSDQGRVVTLAVVALILLYVSLMFTSNMTLMLEPQRWTAYFDRPDGTFLNFTDPTYFPRWLHFIVAAPAIAGLAIGVYYREKNPDFSKTGMNWFVKATLLNLVFGFWFLVALPRNVLFMFMGDSAAATGVFVISLLCVGMMLAVALKNRPVSAAVWAGITILLMSINRHMVRLGYLEEYLESNPFTVSGEYSPLVLFLISLLVVLIGIGWMLKAAFRAEREA